MKLRTLILLAGLTVLYSCNQPQTPPPSETLIGVWEYVGYREHGTLHTPQAEMKYTFGQELVSIQWEYESSTIQEPYMLDFNETRLLIGTKRYVVEYLSADSLCISAENDCEPLLFIYRRVTDTLFHPEQYGFPFDFGVQIRK